MKTAFFDVDTQIDFLFPAGALYVPGAEKILPAIARLNRHAAKHGIPLVSTMDAHPEDDPEFHAYPAHCVAGTWGQRKPAEALVEGQILFEKVTVDVFENPRVSELLEWDRYVVYGVVTEICVRHASLGLLKAGKSVELVTDAIRSLSDANASAFLQEFSKLGGTLTLADAVCV
jgi:nicotinamidase/pyrazinamidase